MTHPVLFLVGPTGSGKTELSLLLAQRLGCEIVSCDSMQVYQGMGIGTAKPTPAEQRKIRHHLIDRVLPRVPFSVYQHRKQALQAIEEILKRRRIPLIVGGGGLYVEAIWKGLSAHPGGNAKLREKFEREAERKMTAFLYEKLRKLDPLRAQKIHPHDRRRIIRALEIAELSGKTPSEWYREKRSLADLGYSVRGFGISRDREDLYQRINRRVESMFRKGFLKEVKRLKRTGFSKTASQALGYREILEYLEEGGKKNGISDLIRKIQTRTRQFAKRQLTWLRREKEIRWIPWSVAESCSAVCDKIIQEVNLWLRNEPCLSSFNPRGRRGVS